MKEISATDAARGFSAVLDAVEHDGETFVVTRGGKRIARIEASAGATGVTVKQLLRTHASDPEWSDDLHDLRAFAATQDRSWRD